MKLNFNIKSTFASVLVLLGLILSTQIQAAEKLKSDDPYQLFQLVTENAFIRFKQDWPKVEQNPELLKTIISEELLPYIDYEYASFKVLGKNLRGQSKSEIKDFVAAFRDYIVTIYAQLFINYRSEQSIIVEPSRKLEGDKIVVVRSKIVEPGRPDIAVTFKLINRGSQGWRAFDMEAEGISVLSTKQKEISAAISKMGFKDVIADLQDKANKTLKFKTDEEKAS